MGVYGWTALAAGQPAHATWPLVPALCVALAAGVDALLQRAPGRAEASRARRILTTAAVIIVLGTLAQTIDRDWRRRRGSPAERAAAWLVTRVQPDERIAIEGGRLRLPPGYAVTHVTRLIDRSPDEHRAGGAMYLVSSADVSDVFLRDPRRFPVEAAAYRELFSRFAIAASFAARGRTESSVTVLSSAETGRK
jgi:hypothetical protein